MTRGYFVTGTAPPFAVEFLSCAAWFCRPLSPSRTTPRRAR